MSRSYSGKTSIFVLSCRLAAMTTLSYIAIVWVFYDNVLGNQNSSSKAIGLIFWWLCVQLGTMTMTFFIAFVMKLGCAIFYGNRPEYWQWVQQGGSPFWDILPWPINTDSNKVRMAISRPPSYDNCPNDGWPMGRKFGNQCRYCGYFHDQG